MSTLRRWSVICGFLVGIVGVMTLLTTCGREYALLLTVKAQKANYLVEVFDLRVKNIATGEIVLERIGEKVDPKDANRDISEPGKELKISVEFSQEGNYLIYFQGRSASGSETPQFALRDYQVDDVLYQDITLVMLVGDVDKDGFPACRTPGIKCPPNSCNFLDCDDNNSAVHPFATEICKNGKDDDCSAGCSPKNPGDGDEECVDNDGDKVPKGVDCDDNDPCRSPKIKEAKNMCQAKAADWNNQYTKACIEKMKKEGKTFNPPLCGDGVDQDCDGKDAACFVDKDCDSYSPPQDCKDNDPTINPAAVEKCDGKDNNCDGVIDEGCIPCDVDGDQHALKGTTIPNCTLPKDDTDDYDSGVHPKVTSDTNNKEGGTVLTALRGFCSDAAEKNGKDHRDIDHDGDGLPASADGCPTLTCDVDGDGFAGKQCSPPASKLDCDDTDPEFFPGAPDKCNDGKAQNCVADGNCSCDKDGDGYCATTSTKRGDCNDNDKLVHPWATEICDKIDNDCDLLVDEGNPDHSGKLIPTNTKLCNDDKDGECSPAATPRSGICACSALTPKGKRDEANRDRCAGEDLKDNASQRCFGAIQPQLEHCDAKDWDCNGKNPPGTGESFVEKSLSCGTNTGQCTAGTVTGCDLSRTVDARIKSVLLAKGKYDERWICTGTKYPSSEKCNGFDDDCDGVKTKQDVKGTDLGWAELDEKDADDDNYMKCGSVNQNCSFPLATPLLGCGDCQDINEPKVYPTGYEYCNNKDDNCLPGDDGKDQCKPPLSCCSLQYGCRNLNTDFANCKTCGNKCIGNISDKCVNASCVCGSTGGVCTGSKNCIGGTCKCSAGGLCTGCCKNNNCYPGNTTADCGKGGVACKACTTGNPCKYPTCSSSGNCGTANRSNNINCPSGKCWSGNCCTGCIGGGSCQQGTTATYCGSGGASCSSCATSDPCKIASCATGACVISNRSNGTTCPSGLCYNGSCCQGCWNGSSCRPGNTTSVCGTGGANCGTCSTSNPCKYASCSTKTCNIFNRSNTTPCSGNSGQCWSGTCCTGCWNGSCQTGTSIAACGDGGDPCTSCNSGQACSGGNCICTTSSCSGCCSGTSCLNGTTTSNCGSGGTSCTSCGSGQTCSGGSCVCNSSSCSGCCDGTTCRSGTTSSRCGTGGASCQTCGSGQTCVAGMCVCNSSSCGGCCSGTTCLGGTSSSACGTGGSSCQSCGSGQTCVGGTCVCNTSSCSGCCSGNTCNTGTSSSACGSGGAACVSCGSGRTCVGGTCVCNSSSCSGCCSGNWCYSGTSTSNCGTGGASCTSCSSGQACSGGTCVCNASSCSSGCCSGNTCNSGTSSSSCGTGGAACVACGSGQTCVGGTCVCNASSCGSGCCSGNTCLPGTSDTACGTGGASCQSCTSPAVCTLQVCT